MPINQSEHWDILRHASDESAPEPPSTSPAAAHLQHDYFRALIEKSYDVILLSNEAGRYSYASPSIQRVLGYTPAEFVQLNGFAIIHPDDIPSIAEAFQELLARPGHSDTRQFRGLHKNGEWRWVEATATNLLHDPGIQSIVTNFHDITELKQAEERQRLLSEASNLLSSSIDHQITLQDIAELIVPALADYCRIAILDEQRQIKEIVVNHIDPQKITLVRALYDQYKNLEGATYGIQRVLNTGRPDLISNVPEMLGDGTQYRSELMAIIKALDLQSYMGVPLITKEKIIGAMTFSSIQPHRHYTHNDLAFALELAHRIALTIENARLYHEARQTRDQLAIIFQGVTDGIIVYDKHGQVIFANAAAAQMTNMTSPEELSATPSLSIFERYEPVDEQGQPFPPSRRTHLRILEGEQQAEAIIGYTNKTTAQIERWSLVRSHPVLDESGDTIIVITIIQDITEQMQAERRKDEFISMTSHELRTPITSLKGFANVLQRRLIKQGDQQGLYFLARMDAQLDKLTTLVNNLLDISKMQAGKLALQVEALDLELLLQEAVGIVQAATTSHHIYIEGGVPVRVLGDKDRLEQVFINLLTNAIKYSPGTDRVLVQLSHEKDQAIVSVQDFGIGIDEAHHQKIFERFYQVVDPEVKTYPGMGMGLYISSEIVARHHGRLWVESKKGAGSTFFVALPLLRDA